MEYNYLIKNKITKNDNDCDSPAGPNIISDKI